MPRGGERLTVVEGYVCTCIYVVAIFCDLAIRLLRYSHTHLFTPRVEKCVKNLIQR